MIVPEDRIKRASKNGAAFYFYCGLLNIAKQIKNT